MAESSSISSQDRARILDELTGATCALVVNEPFFGHFFSGILKEVHDGVNTLGIGPAGNQVKLYINPQFWTESLRSLDLRKGLLKHEILHLVFKHIFRNQDIKRKDIYNVACDLVVNQYIRINQLPEDRVHMGLFPDLALESDREAEYYYTRLLGLHDEMTGESSPSQNEDSEQQDSEEEGQGSPNPNSSSTNESWENLKNLLNGHHSWAERHEQWNEIDALPKAAQEVLSDAVDHAIMNSIDRAKVKGWGDLPGHLRQYLKAFEQGKRPEINWKRVLRMFTESSTRTLLRNTVRRPSKRYGTTPGIKIRRRQKLLLAIDTSFSVTPQEMDLFFNEVYHIWKRGAEIMVLECDTKINATFPYRGLRPQEVHGRGGTDLNPPLAYGNESFLPDALIYFTDGFAPTPQIKPRYPVLWVISGSGIEADTDVFRALPGQKVRLPAIQNEG